MDEFIEWYCSEPRLSLNKVVVTRFRIFLEIRGLAAATINGRLAAVRRLAYEAADAGLLSPELASLGERFVSMGHAMQACECCRVLETHAKRIYQFGAAPHLQSARLLAKKLSSGEIGRFGVFKPADVYLKGWSGLSSVDSTYRAIDVLIDAGWIRTIRTESSPRGGAPAKIFEVHPIIRLRARASGA